MPLLTTIGHWISEPPPERLFELSESAIAVASYGKPLASKLERLAEKSLTPSPSGPNLTRPESYREVLDRSAPVSVPRRNTAALVIPDYSVRMTVLEFEQFPSNEDDRVSLLRFRLRKSVPFHVEDARITYSIQLQELKRVEVLVIAIARPILIEYEAVLTEAGYRVGLVLPSTVAALPLFTSAPQNGLTLAVKTAGTTVSVLLLQAGRVRLARCIDLAAGEESADYADASVLDLLQQTVAFAEDQIGTGIERVLLCGFGERTERIGSLAQTEFGVPYDNVRSRFGPAAQENAGLLGLMERFAA